MAKSKTKISPKKTSTKKNTIKPKTAVKKTVKKKTIVTQKAKTAIKKKAVVKAKIVKKSIAKSLVNKKSSAVKKAAVIKVKRSVPAKVLKNTVTASSSQTAEIKIRKFKPNKKTRYTKSELKYFRDIILKERKAIFESAKANMDALVDKESGEYKGDNLTYSSHMAEQGTDEMEREKNYLFVQRDEKYLGYLQDALTRIDQGTYGICVDCREVPKNLCRSCPLIAKERLELVPITQHCIECKNLRG